MIRDTDQLFFLRDPRTLNRLSGMSHEGRMERGLNLFAFTPTSDSSSSSAIDSRAEQIFSPADATKPAVI